MTFTKEDLILSYCRCGRPQRLRKDDVKVCELCCLIPQYCDCFSLNSKRFNKGP